MRKIFREFIALILCFNLLLPGGFAIHTGVYAQETTPPPDPAPTNPPSDPQPTSPPQPSSAPQPSSPPVPRGSYPSPTADPQPTNNPPSPTPINTSPTPTDPSVTPTPTGEESSDPAAASTYGGDPSGSYSSGSVNDPANIGTGPFSTNSATETNEQKLETLNQNLAQLDNIIKAAVETGFNNADYNTLTGSVTTGNAEATYNLLNKLNSNITGAGGFSIFNIYDTYIGDLVFSLANNNVTESFSNSSSTVSKNSVTGPGSTNTADSLNSFIVKEATGNDAQLTNDINLSAITGGNSASFNTGGGDIETGDASALANIINLVNTNIYVNEWLIAVVNIFGTFDGNIVLPQGDSSGNSADGGNTVLTENNVTGPLSDNTATYNNSEIASFENSNEADITSNLELTSNSGGNDTSFNTGGGSVVSGNSDLSVNDTTVANVNIVDEDGTVWLVIINQMGKWIGQLIGAPWGSTSYSNSLPITNGTSSDGVDTLTQNSVTGPLSSNDSTFANSSDTSTSNSNQADIVNNISMTADTGNNQASFNTYGGDIDTGDAKVGLNLFNMANTNITADKLIIVFINILGDFLGDVITPGQNYTPQPGGIDESDQELSIGGPDETDSENYNPGPNAENIPPTLITSTNNYNYFSTGPTNLNAVATPTGVSAYTPRSSRSPRSNPYPSYYQSGINFGATPYIGQYPTQVPRRGIFVSQAFAKATEVSIAGMLLDGISLRVNNSWLLVLPIAVLFIAIRRSRKYDFAKIINSLLDIIL